MFQNNIVSIYRREILLVLIVKLILVLALKQAFFSDPVSKTLTVTKVSETIIGINSNSSGATLPARNKQ